MLRRPVLYGAAALGLVALTVTIVGYALPVAHVATVSRTVGRPPADVFARLLDVSRYPEWRKGVSRVELIASDPLKWGEHTGGDVITYEVVERRPPGRLVVRIADPELPFGGTWTYELRPEGSGTHVTITEHGEVYNPIFRFMSRFVFSATATMEAVLDAL